MDKEELGRKISERVRNKDSELAQKTISEIITYVSNFYSNDIALEGHYEEVQISSSAYKCNLKVFDTTLEYKLDDKKISVTKEENGQVTNIDEINIDNGKTYCKHGKFSIEEIEKHLIESFKSLI
ncbi:MULTISPECIES: hypothetical protein [unclassified Oceanobacillus]|uniref:hypothetical protein n=1 Tax=unclassified Oceanobacillus TaxID=2630292 RepID=UPI00300DEAE2